ncbi:MAG: replicative DNA helicase, partial [Actinomycetota bacterium]
MTSVAELGEYEPAGPPAEDLGRTPPQDVAAEQSVLGGMMLSKDAIADVVEVLRGADFYRPAHELVYEAIIDLYGRGEPADAVTVADELTKRGELGRIGGAAYLHTLISSVPTAANAGYYARIVHERAVLRRLVEAGTRIVQLGYSSAGDVDEIVNSAQAEVYAVTERRASEDYLPISEIIESTIDEIEASSHRGDGMIGVPTGFADLDRLTNGLHAGQMIVIAARPAIGKCLASSSLITDAYTGRRMTVAEFVGRGRAGEKLGVHTLDERWQLRVTEPSDFVDNGVRQVFRLRLGSGRQVTATANHPLRTLTGWVPLEDLVPGDRVAVPRRLPAWRRRRRSPYGDAIVALTGMVLAGGRLTADDVVRVDVPGPAVAADVRGWAVELDLDVEEQGSRVCPDGALCRFTEGAEVRPDEPGHRHPTRLLLKPGASGRNELALALHAFGLVGLTGSGPRVPDGFFSLPDRQALLLLQRMFAVGGWVQARWRSRGAKGLRAEAGLVTGTERLARDVAHLLLRFGVLAEVHEPVEGARTAPGWWVLVRDPEQVATFCREVGVLGQEQRCAEVRAACRAAGTVETMPEAVAELVAKARDASGWTVLDGDPVPADGPLDRAALRALADRFESVELRSLSTSDVWWDEVVEVTPAGVERVYDLTVDGTHNFVADDVVVHNSTIGLDIARSAAIRHGLTTVIFSLEMSRNEITMRMLSAEARIPLQNMRKGTMREEDWTRLARTMGQVSEAPLFIDDSPNMSLMEIRAKCRRLKQRHDLKLVVVDYLQLMTSGKRVESRQQEVSEFSRALKLLAKELEVPVIAISQLNRGPEQRTDKKPQMSDLRESGCLTADTRVMRADTGAEVTLGELLASGARDIPVWSLNERLQLVPRTMTHVFPSGVKDVYRLRLASGREITATANHPFLTYDGWKPLGELAIGTRLGVVRHVPPPLEITPWDEDEIVLLAHLIGDGSFVRRQPIRYASVDEENLAAVAGAAKRRFGISPIRDEYAAARCTTLRLPAPYRLTHGKRNPIAAWLDELGLFGLRSHEKFVPPGVFGLPKEQVALFLRHLWATDGCVHWYGKHGFGRIYYASTSRRLADDVARLLLRFNIVASVRRVAKNGYRDCYQVLVYGSDQQRRFLDEIGVHGARSDKAASLREKLTPIVSRERRGDPASGVWAQVRSALRSGVAGAATELSAVTQTLDRADIDVVATNDVAWDELRDIEPLGPCDVYDATVLGLHNFVGNGISIHNSIEQDADMVILLHREDAYERESPRAGEADIIVAKHRNGPTD